MQSPFAKMISMYKLTGESDVDMREIEKTVTANNAIAVMQELVVYQHDQIVRGKIVQIEAS